MTQGELVYPISLRYRKEWSEWEAIRELVQNILDTNSEFKIFQENGDTVLVDRGGGLKVRHLLLGVSEKSADSRGKYGEGLKLALIVLIRLGYSVTIQSGSLEIRTSQAKIAEETCLKLTYEEVPHMLNGTRVTIHGYSGSLFEERFATHPKIKEKVVFKNSYLGDIIDIPSVLFVKDIYVTALGNSAFSYNLRNVSLSESRNISNEFETHNSIGLLWTYVNKQDMLERLLDAIANDKYEARCSYAYKSDHPDKVLAAWNAIYGKKSVIATSPLWTKEAQWRGAKVVSVPANFIKFLLGGVKTDIEYVTEHDNGNDTPVPTRLLDKSQRRALQAANVLMDLLTEGRGLISNGRIPVKAYQLFNYENGRAAVWDNYEKTVKIDYRRLSSLQNTFEDTLHEAAHALHSARDNSVEMIHALSRIGSIALLKALYKTEQGRPLRNAVRRFYETIP